MSHHTNKPDCPDKNDSKAEHEADINIKIYMD